MYLSNSLAFVHLQKTGGTYISKELSKLDRNLSKFPKHQKANYKLLGRPILGSVRDPWSYYVSLWAYGCLQKGGLHRRLTKKYHLMQKLMLFHTRKYNKFNLFLSELYNELNRSASFWIELYSDSKNTQNFRKWLKSIHNIKNYKCLGKNYAASNVSKMVGLYTFRYLYMFCGDRINLNRIDPKDIDALLQLDHETNYVDYFIKLERLEHDLNHVIKKHVKHQDIKTFDAPLKAEKTNESKHLETSQYYDLETLELVYKRDYLIIEKHNYKQMREDILKSITNK